MSSGAAASLVELGVAAGDVGTLSISGTGTLQDGGALNVGEGGTGTLNITKGGTASDSDATVAPAPARPARTRRWTGSTWSHDGAITIGENANATGILTISNGGTVSSGANGAGSIIGHDPTSSGTVNREPVLAQRGSTQRRLPSVTPAVLEP